MISGQLQQVSHYHKCNSLLEGIKEAQFGSVSSSRDVFLYLSLDRPLGIANEQKKLYGTQFHPEVDLTERGMEMLRTFLFEIAGCSSNFTVQNRQQTCINEIQEKVGTSKVLVSAFYFLSTYLTSGK